MERKTSKARTTEQVLKEQEGQAKATRENAVVKVGSTALIADGSNPWIEVSAELDKFVGAPFVRFSKQGEFEISDTETIPASTRCIAHADEIMFGWRKWSDNKVVETRMGRVADRYVPAQRKDLGDTDESQWEMQDDDTRRDPTRRDPWQFCATVPLTRATTRPGDLVVDPAAGSFVVLHAARELRRDFIGCDVAYKPAAVETSPRARELERSSCQLCQL